MILLITYFIYNTGNPQHTQNSFALKGTNRQISFSTTLYFITQYTKYFFQLEIKSKFKKFLVTLFKKRRK